MKKVLYKRWIPAEYIKDEKTGQRVLMEGTGCTEDTFTGKAVFHTYIMYMAGTNEEYAGAILELPNGELTEKILAHIKFVRPAIPALLDKLRSVLHKWIKSMTIAMLSTNDFKAMNFLR